MIRITDLPAAIQTAINGWRVWVTLALLVSLLLNEAVIGLREGQTITQSLTRIPYYLLPYLLLVCGAIAQAGIGAIPFATGVIMTLYDVAIKRRQNWKQEGKDEGREEWWSKGRAEERRQKIAAVLAHPELSAEHKVLFISILNADDAPDEANSD